VKGKEHPVVREDGAARIEDEVRGGVLRQIQVLALLCFAEVPSRDRRVGNEVPQLLVALGLRVRSRSCERRVDCVAARPDGKRVAECPPGRLAPALGDPAMNPGVTSFTSA